MSQIGHLKKGLNPPSLTELEAVFGSTHLSIAIKTGIITGIIALAVSDKHSTKMLTLHPILNMDLLLYARKTG